MKVGLNLPVAHPESSPALLRDLARQAEELGFSELFLGEHVVLFDELSDRYQGTDDGKPFFPSTSSLPDPLVAHAFVASCTERIRLGTGVLLLPQRNPVYTAKHVATLDWLSNGRIDLGVGIGWSSQEFEACNVPWEHRAARAEEYLAVMVELWAHETSTFKGAYYTLPPCRQYPKPVQRPHPPIWIGGWTDRALDRAARLGDGWYGFDLPVEELSSRLARLRALCSAQGKVFETMSVAVGGYAIQPHSRRELDTYARLGATLFAVTPRSGHASEMPGEIREVARRLLGRV
jgi:probable F420-dependent oxidoreductase